MQNDDHHCKFVSLEYQNRECYEKMSKRTRERENIEKIKKILIEKEFSLTHDAIHDVFYIHMSCIASVVNRR